MNVNTVRQWVGRVACVLGVVVSAQASATAYSNLYFFGDSLSDTGNLYLATLGTVPASPPYDNGRFSNGPLWTEDFAQALGFTATPSLKGGNDYAFAGATIGSFGRLMPTLPQQLGTYLQQTGNVAKADALYVILGGGNDLSEAVKDPTTAAAKVVASATTEAGMVSTLYAAGARNVLVVNLPNVGRTPQVSALGAAAAQGGNALSQLFDATLASNLGSFAAQTNGLSLDLFNLYGFEQTVLANPSAYGFSNTTDACKSGAVAGAGTVCATPGSYYYWDQFHPTATTHALIAQAALASLTPVPEPSTIGLFVAGLAVLGVVARRRA